MKTTHIARPAWIIIASLTCAVLAAASINYYLNGPERRAQAQYEAAITHDRMSSVDDLIDRLPHYQFGGLPPIPGTNAWEHTLSSAHPVDWENFPESFQKGLIGYWYNDIPVYELYVYQDRSTREIVFLNADGKEIHSVPCPYEAPYCTAEGAASFFGALPKNPDERADYVAWRDPARLGLHFMTLVPSDRLYEYLFARQLDQDFELQSAAPVPMGGSPQMLMLSGSDAVGISAINLLTNAVELEFTSTYSTVTSWDLFRSEDLVSPEWSLLETDIAITNGQVATRNVSTNHDFSVYALGRAEDLTGDGVRDSFGFFLYGLGTEDLNAGLAAHWPMDETSGIVVQDSVNTNNAILYGTTASAGRPGPLGRAMLFGGTNDPDGDLDYAIVPDSASLNIQTNLTLTGWVLPGITHSDRQAIFQKGGAFYLNLMDGKVQFYGEGLSPSGYKASTSALSTGTWSHVAVTFGGSAVQFYINGIQDASVSVTGTLSSSSNDLGIGFGFGDGRHFQGMLDDLRIYSTTLTSNQVVSLYQAGGDTDGDGLSFADESLHLTDFNDADTDGDGLDDGDELTVYLTDPLQSNEFSDISGNVTYKGSSAGQVVVIASPTRFGWATHNSVTLPNTGTYTIADVPVRSNYWIRAFRDLNSNGVYEANEPPHFTFTNIAFSASGATNVNVHIEKLRGMRVELGAYYGGQWTGWTSAQIAQEIVDNAEDWGVNTLYVRAMNPVFGTYWANPTNQYLYNEGGHGANDILNTLITKAHAKDQKVIAWLQPVNANTNAWGANPDWRYKRLNGDDFNPGEGWLTPFNTNAMNWLEGVVHEVLDQGVDGIDVAETDYGRFSTDTNLIATFDVAATNLYFSLYPNGALGDENWFRLRDATLTKNIYERLGRVVKLRGKEVHVTATWDAKPDGTIQPDHIIAENTGIRFGAIMDLPEDSRPDYVVPEFIWQREADDHPASFPSIFNPEWTVYATTTFVGFARGRVLPSIHPEITKKSVVTNIVPTLSQFQETLAHSLTNTGGCDFFIHDLAYTNGYLPNGTNVNSFGYEAVSNVFRSAK